MLTTVPLATASLVPGRIGAIVLLAGLTVLTVALGILTWTRWGQGRPIAKCALLSLFAHVLLLCYCWGTRILFDTPGRLLGDGEFQVRIVDDAEEEAPQAETQAEALPDQQLAAKAPEPPPGERSEPAASNQTSPRPDSPVAPPPLIEPPPTSVADEGPPQPPPEESVAGSAMPTADDPPVDFPATSMDDPPVEFPESVPVVVRPVVPRRLGDGQEVPPLLSSRVGNRIKLAERFGGSATTEKAVEAALDWLAASQSAGGRWDADLHGAGRENQHLGHDRGGAGKRADTGITGLAVLAFLGAGQTHLAGKHREKVQHALEFLLASQAADGNLAGDAELFARMYCHGIGTLALCEAYALSGDERLKEGATRAVHYSLRAQHVEGGWRYQPGDRGDMSQFGWQVMALKSAELAGIAVPSETKLRMARFLRSCSFGTHRGLASYRPGDQVSRTMTAEALVCRVFLGAENSDAALDEGTRFLMGELPTTRDANVYYWYYGTLALFQRQGADWPRWNRAMQEALLGSQRFDGAYAGSWDPDRQWGSYGGRVYSTALGAMCLEIYYRYLPLYGGDPETRFTGLPESPALPR